MKRIAALFLTTAFVLSLNTASFAQGRKFGASYMTLNSTYFIAMNETIKAIVKYNGDTLITLDPERDQAKQNSQINELIAQGVDAIFLAPVDWQGVTEGLRACKKAGVPVINVDSPVYDEELVTCIIDSNNEKIGRLCAEDLMKRLWGGKIAILKNPITKTGADRSSNFEEIISSTPGFIIVAKRDYQGGRDNAKAVMQDILKKTPDIDAVMCTSDTIAMGAIDALREAGRLKNVLVYGVNASPEGKKAIQAGEMTGTVGQSPISMGHIACDIAYAVLNGEKVEKHISVPVLFIDANNLNHFFLDGWQ